MAIPMPPPMHSVARPFLASRFCISCSSVTRTRAPEAPIGMAEGDGAAVDVDLAGVPAEVLVDGAGLRREGLVGLDQVEVVGLPAGLLRAAREAGIGPEPMMAGSTPACAQDTIRASGVLPSLAASARAHQHHGGGAVVDARGVAGGDRALLVEGGAQLGDAFQRHAGLRDIRRCPRPRRPCGPSP